VPVESGSFVIQSGQYEFLFVPFGISNSPAGFTRLVMSVFQELVASGIVIPKTLE